MRSEESCREVRSGCLHLAMDAEVWRNFPSELLERTLSFLPIAALSRFRIVCRRWNAIICDPGFVHHATQEFVVGRYAIRGPEPGINDEEWEFESFNADHGYTFLDVQPTRWHTICHDEPALFDCYTAGGVAMDGGLVCHVLESDNSISVFLTNPVENLSRRLPPAPHYSTGRWHLKVDMAVADRTCTIFLMPGVDAMEAPLPPMVTYDTTSNKWRTAAHLPSLPTGQESCVSCCVVFGESLYALLIPNIEMDVTEHWLWRYDNASWSDAGVAIRGCTLVNPKLMVSGDSRMLLATWKQMWKDGRSSKFVYEVSEVDMERGVVEALVSVDVEQMFGAGAWDCGLGSMHAVSMGECVVMVWKPTGAVRIYNLRTSEWDESVPANPVMAVEGFRGFQMWYGKAMHLNLPSNTVWIHESGDA